MRSFKKFFVSIGRFIMITAILLILSMTAIFILLIQAISQK